MHVHLQCQVYFVVFVAASCAPAFRDRFYRTTQQVTDIVDSRVECHKTTMTVRIQLAEPFYGYIYPAGRFDECVIFEGSGETDILLKLRKDPCGTNFSSAKLSMVFDPVIEHELMIQWDRDLVEETDTHLIVRCSHADQFRTLTAAVEIL